jgi:hypothetical protein
VCSVSHPTRSGASPLWGGEAAEALKLSKADDAAAFGPSEGLGSDAGVAALGYRHGAEAAVDAALLRAAFAGGAPDPAVREEARRGAEARFPLKAADLMPGLTGPALGAKLRELEALWIASGFTLDREALLGMTLRSSGFSSGGGRSISREVAERRPPRVPVLRKPCRPVCRVRGDRQAADPSLAVHERLCAPVPQGLRADRGHVHRRGSLSRSGSSAISGGSSTRFRRRRPARSGRSHGTELLLVALLILFIRPALQALDVLLLNNAIMPNFGTLIRWRAHRHVLRQSVGWFENDFAGRIANRIMQTPPPRARRCSSSSTPSPMPSPTSSGRRSSDRMPTRGWSCR